MTCPTPGCGRVATGALCGACYARWARGIPAESRESVCAIPDCPGTHWASGFCRAHHTRLQRGADLSVPLHPRKVRGATYRPRTGREPMRPVLREAETLWAIVGNAESGQGRTGGVVEASSWASENRQAEQLGTPQMWQQVADEALERAWDDLMSGRFETRLKARHTVLRPAKPKSVQSPLMGVLRPAGRSEVPAVRRAG